MNEIDSAMTAADFLSWCRVLTGPRLAQVQELLTCAAATFEDVPLHGLRDGVRRTLEDCWRVGIYDVDGALELLKAEMVAYA